MALYSSSGFETAQSTSENAALPSDKYGLARSSFTPINRHSLPTPQSSLVPQPAEQTGRPPRGKQCGKRPKPNVAQQSGLDVGVEPQSVKKYASVVPVTPLTPPRRRKQSRKTTSGHNSAEDASGHPNVVKQSRVSDGFRVTKPASRKPARKNNAADFEPAKLQIDVSSQKAAFPCPMPNVPKATTLQVFEHHQHSNQNPETPSGGSFHGDVAGLQPSPDPDDPDMKPSYMCSLNNSPSSSTSLSFGHYESQDTIAEEGIDDLFNSINVDLLTNNISTGDQNQLCTRARPESDGEENLHDYFAHDDSIDEDLYLLTCNLNDDFSSTLRVPQIDHKSENPILSTSAASSSAPHNCNPRGASGRFVSPVTPKTKAFAQRADLDCDKLCKPIVRSKFPSPVRDRSPIIGLSSNQLLRTCFRIGETINQASHAIKHGQTLVFELYARVLHSSRDEIKQYFVFGDLFHDKQPYIKGVYEAAIWRHVELYNYDSGRLLENSRMCRCIGTMKRDGKEWVMTVLNVWETTWEDVAWVEGILRP